jgi:hypothetical protein
MDYVWKCIRIALGSWLDGELTDVVRPFSLDADTILIKNFGTITKFGTRVLVYSVVQHTFIVVNEEAAEVSVLSSCDWVLVFIELQNSSPSVCGAASQLALVFDIRTPSAKVSGCGNSRGERTHRSKVVNLKVSCVWLLFSPS